MKLTALVAAFLTPAAALATPFEKHSGAYDVLAAPAGYAEGCPIQRATIAREAYGEFAGFVLRAEGRGTADDHPGCTADLVSGLSAEGFSGVTCTETEDQIACNAEKGNFITSANVGADGVTNLTLESTGQSPSKVEWRLRRR